MTLTLTVEITSYVYEFIKRGICLAFLGVWEHKSPLPPHSNISSRNEECQASTTFYCSPENLLHFPVLPPTSHPPISLASSSGDYMVFNHFVSLHSNRDYRRLFEGTSLQLVLLELLCSIRSESSC